MKKIGILFVIALGIWACQNEPKEAQAQDPREMEKAINSSLNEEPPQVDLNDPELQEKVRKLEPKAHNNSGEPILIKGVNLNETVNPQMVMKGQQVYQNKCASCHNLNDKAFKASGFGDFLQRREPAFFMNMVTGVKLEDFAPASDISTLKKCWTRQESNKLTIIEARDMVELLVSENQ